MVSAKVIISNETGIHARPASELLTFTKKFKSKVKLKSDTKEANCASIISILALGAKKGTSLEVIVEGEDETTALPLIVEFINTMEG